MLQVLIRDDREILDALSRLVTTGMQTSENASWVPRALQQIPVRDDAWPAHAVFQMPRVRAGLLFNLTRYENSSPAPFTTLEQRGGYHHLHTAFSVPEHQTELIAFLDSLMPSVADDQGDIVGYIKDDDKPRAVFIRAGPSPTFDDDPRDEEDNWAPLLR